MNKAELTKVKSEKKNVVKRLDDFSAKGITPDQVAEFNELCRQEFILTAKERLLEVKPGENSIIIPPRIQRKITIRPVITKKIN